MGLTFSEIRFKAAESELAQPCTQEAIAEGKEYTVLADVSHPTNRGLSVTKSFKHTAESPDEAIKAAKKHITSRGWKVHSATIKEETTDVVEEGAAAIAAKKQQDINDVFGKHVSSLEAAHKKLGEHIEKMKSCKNPTWGHVGSAEQMHKDINDAHGMHVDWSK